MFRLSLRSDGDLERDLEEMAERATDLSGTDNRIADAVVRQNAGVNFDPGHQASVLEVSAGAGQLGSESSSYARLLDVDEDELAEIEREWILEGSQ